MNRLCSKRGVALVDAMITVLLLAAVGVVFGATFPSGFATVRQAGDNAKATTIAQKKIEQLRSLPYESLTYPLLRSGDSKIDEKGDQMSPFWFTGVDNVSTQLPEGLAKLEITDDSATVRRIVVTVSYDGPNGITRQVVLTTLVSDKRAKVGT